MHPGESPVFSCFSQNANVDIQFKAAVGSTDPVLIYSTIRGTVDSKYDDDYTVTVSSGNYNLTVLNASSADAGTYKCESDSGSESAELVVIGMSAKLAKLFDWNVDLFLWLRFQCVSRYSEMFILVLQIAKTLQLFHSWNGSFIWMQGQSTWMSALHNSKEETICCVKVPIWNNRSLNVEFMTRKIVWSYFGLTSDVNSIFKYCEQVWACIVPILDVAKNHWHSLNIIIYNT